MFEAERKEIMKPQFRNIWNRILENANLEFETIRGL
jgi:hypothetical protein